MEGNQASALVWVAVAFFVGFCALIYTSSWLRGLKWFVAAMLTLAGTMLLLGIDALTEGVSVKAGLVLLLLTWLFCFMFYVIGSRYVTRTRLLDLTYNSREALERYLTQNQIHSSLAQALRAMPLVLVLGMALMVGLGYWAKTGGLIT
jgi:hypothetical protein